ncbi:MAG: type IV pilus twitching motility protein PilT [Candidatus Eisenbacteria bacterium]|nr:type IV pilus twitching motility protein PilT [Candidatus Eisenbacteria bacterium]
MARIDAIFRTVKANDASDLHMVTGARPMLRIQGEIRPIEYAELTPEMANALLGEILSADHKRELEEQGDVDFAYEVPGEVRLRCNVYRQHRGLAGAFRLLPSRIMKVSELDIPGHILRFTEAPKGLVVVTGPPGSGKSTTLAALIDHINETTRKHILTIEDPIEYIHVNKNSLINQREIGRNAASFPRALRAALREDPNIILVGEMRDLETIRLALTAAETGQLVFGTLHTTSAHQTVDRIIDAFPADQQEQVRVMVADGLRGVIAQKLLPRADGKGRVPAVEVLATNKAISTLIREKKTFQIPSLMQIGKKGGMQIMDEEIVRLIREGTVTEETGLLFANEKEIVRSSLRVGGGGAAARPVTAGRTAGKR